MNKLRNYTLLVMASTYPRWPNDTTRSFVKDYVHAIAPDFKRVRVVVPHYKEAKHSERTDNVKVTRFYYTWPFKYENLMYGELPKTIGYPAKVLLYHAAELWATFYIGLSSRPLLINAHWLIPQGFIAALVKPVVRCPLVISIHGKDVYTFRGKYALAVKRFALKRADAVICNSSATKSVCEQLVARDYHVIPMGVDLSLFQQRKPKPVGEIFELLFVGRLNEQKGVQYLLEALKILRANSQRVHATIIGDGGEKSKLEAYVTDNDLHSEVAFTGGLPHEQVADYYAKADVFVGPSIESKDGWQEAFGLVFAEASATGVPVVATSTGGIQDIVKDGVNGLVVPQKDATAIANAIEKLMSNPELCKMLGTAGPKFIEQSFSWPVIIEKYKAVFEGLL